MCASAVVTACANAEARCSVIHVVAWCATDNVCAVKVCLVSAVLRHAHDDVLRAARDGAAVVSGVLGVFGISVWCVGCVWGLSPRLRAAYTGNAIEVTDGSTTQDIGFDSNGELDQSALETYANGAEVKVSKWYDQTINGRTLSQTSDAARPTITDSSGNMLTLNGKPAMKLNGAQSLPCLLYTSDAADE